MEGLDLIEASTDAIYILGGDHFRYFNRRFGELFGFSTEELTDPAFDLERLVAPESRSLVRERDRRARAQEPLPPRYEFQALRRDEARFDVEVTISNVRYRGSSAVLGIVHDITARKAYEKALLRKNHELSVLNAVADATLRSRELTGILEGVVERMMELLQVDAAGIALLEGGLGSFASVHYRGASETFVRDVKKHSPRTGLLGLACEGQSIQIVGDLGCDPRFLGGLEVREGFRSAVALPLLTHRRASGVISLFTRKVRIFSPEEMELFVAVSRQIAIAIENARLYRKAQEGIARLQALSEIARAIGSTLDVEGVFQIVGERLQRIIRFRTISLDILRRNGGSFSVRSIARPEPGEPAVVRLHEPIEVAAGSPFIEALEDHRTVVVEPKDGSAVHPDGSRLWAIVPIIADKAPLGVFVVGTDEPHGFHERDIELLQDLAAHMAISLKNARVFADLEGAYRDLRDTKGRLVRSEKLQGLGEMAAGVAHDFNNVLSAILGRAQMLKVLLKDEEVLKSLRVIEKAALDGAGTVRRIQEFAKEKSEGKFVAVSVNPIVRDAVEMNTTRVNEMGIEIETQVELQEVGPILANAAELREVLTNLISNAIDAMPHGGRLAIRTGNDADTDQVWFEVEDTGIGMDEETQQKIFDPFFTTKGTRGTGLGMSVSYGIVQRHKGEFVVRSEKGVGSTIRVLFPTHKDEAHFDPHELDARTPVPFDLESCRRSSARILVIDDDNAVRDVLADILRTGAHQVVAASTGSEGLELFQSSPFDLVFTDLGMPGMSGWEVARGIKNLSPTTPVGLITGWGATLDEARIKDRGVDLIVSKPFRYNEVLELVAEAMALKGRLHGGD